jgi:hypothetical protein
LSDEVAEAWALRDGEMGLGEASGGESERNGPPERSCRSAGEAAGNRSLGLRWGEKYETHAASTVEPLKAETAVGVAEHGG